jgi:DNA primase
MPIITKRCIEELKARVSIYDVVSPSVSLRKAGASWKGLSPFTQEKTPSFFVSPDRGLYKCFSTGKAGDVFSFVMETERLNFQEAVETIAGRFGIELQYEEGAAPRESRSLRQELFLIHDIATDYFHQFLLSEHPAAAETRTYWEKNRGFSLEAAREFSIGLSPLDGRKLISACLKKEVSLEALKECGLFYQRGSRLTPESLMPRFKGRLMIPIRDHQGRVIAFTARQLALTPKDDPSHDAKYINSPETPLFSKSHVLFGLDRARMAVTDDKPFLLVEGQLDTLRCWQNGLTTAVAPQGTAITEHQLLLLRRYCQRIDCLLDGDSAGQKAALRFLPLALKTGIDVRFFVLPPGQDPDTLLKEGGIEAWQQIAAQPVTAMEFAGKALLPAPDEASAQAKAIAASSLYEIIGSSDSEVARSEYLREAAGVFRLDWHSLTHDFARHSAAKNQQRRPAPGGGAAVAQPSSEADSKLTTVEETLLLLCLHHPEYGQPIASLIEPEWISGDSMTGRLLNLALAEFAHDLWEGPKTLEQLLDTQDEKNFLYSLIFTTPDFDNPAKLANEALQYLYRNSLTSKIREIELEIANKSGTLDAAVILLQRKRNEYRKLLLQPPRL